MQILFIVTNLFIELFPMEFTPKIQAHYFFILVLFRGFIYFLEKLKREFLLADSTGIMLEILYQFQIKKFNGRIMDVLVKEDYNSIGGVNRTSTHPWIHFTFSTTLIYNKESLRRVQNQV